LRRGWHGKLGPVKVIFDAELWLWDARRADAWVFVGSLRVRATIGSSSWTTSIFPGRAGYVLPVKRSIRVAEALDVGDTATVTVELIDFS
jgi:Domain of unknown function (DUF1905)